MQQERRLGVSRNCIGQPRELLKRTQHGSERVANDLLCFTLEEAGEDQRAMALQLRLEDACFVEAGDGKPVAAVGGEGGECFDCAVTVGIGLDDGDGVGVGARGLLAQDAVVAAQGIARDFCPGGAGGGGRHHV